MTANQWQLVEEIFLAALEKKGEERSNYLNEVCASNGDLKREVESLLAYESDGAGVFESAVSEAARNLSLVTDKYIGLRIGPYRIVRQLSQGGMGVVYLAERSDDHYLQTVAIKLIRLGLVSEEIISRFRSERQILANLAHPNIAAILDGGSTEDGLPYIVMEYVEGQPITEYAKRRELSVRDRILLFRSVCLAVHYAHQKLVIHRDIKPGNILVTSEGIPKLLDFGIAKLLAPDLAPCDLTPTISPVRMTPDYASPEQVLGEPLTTGTDVYSLGVVLFELLTGSQPYFTAGLHPRELERIVCQETTSKPSEFAGVPPRIASELRGDLDNIMLMAMRKEPARRYQSAEQLAGDLSRYLEGEPVSARRDTAFYRGGKFIRRHKTSLGTVAALFVALVSGAFTTARQAHKAQQRVKELQALVESVVVTTNDSIANIPQSTAIRAELLKSTLDNLDKLAKDPDIAPNLLIEISHAYSKVGQIQGWPSTANLGQEDAALSSFEKALHIAQQLARRNGSDSDATRLLIETQYSLGQMQNYVGKDAEARANIMAAMHLAKPYQAEGPSDEGRRQLLAGTLTGVADLQTASEQARKALSNYREALAVLENGARGSPKTLQIVGTIYNSLGLALTETGPLDAALEAFRHAADIRERLAGQYPSNLRYQRNLFVTDLNIGRVLGGTEYASMGKLGFASGYITKARSLAERLAQLDTNNAQAKSDLAFAYARTGETETYMRPETAIHWYRKSIALSEELLLVSPGSVNYRLQLALRSQQLAAVLARTGRMKEALSHAQVARNRLADLVQSRPARKDFRRELMTTYCLLGELQYHSRDGTGAVLNQKAALDLLSSAGDNEPDLYVDYSLAKCYDVFGRIDPAKSGEWRRRGEERWSRLTENGANMPLWQ